MADALSTLRESRPAARERNAPIIARLQVALRRALAEAVPVCRDYALLDFPNYSNIGDSAIYVGETILCREYFRTGPKLVTEAFEWELERVARLDPAVPLLLSGGGNFGDLYARHQDFREAILARFPDRKIVQLPQSIHFADEENAARAASFINAHPDFTLMVRDRVSLSFAEAHFRCRTMLVPDMAYMIGPVEPSRKADLRLLGLLRDDQEAIVEDRDAFGRLPQPNAIVDWPKETRADRPVDFLPRRVRRFLPPGRQGRTPASPAGYEWLARKRVQLGFDILSRGEIIVTDRLHAHILSFLLGKPQIVLDNSYGKIGSFVEAWSPDGAFVQAASLEEVIARLDDL